MELSCLSHKCKILQKEHELPNLISFLTQKGAEKDCGNSIKCVTATRFLDGNFAFGRAYLGCHAA